MDTRHRKLQPEGQRFKFELKKGHRERRVHSEFRQHFWFPNDVINFVKCYRIMGVQEDH